jgi:hypothetical protein
LWRSVNSTNFRIRLTIFQQASLADLLYMHRRIFPVLRAALAASTQPPPSRGYGEAEDVGRRRGGRPLRGGTAGSTCCTPRCGLSRSTLTDSWRPPTSMRKNLEPGRITLYGPE